MTMGTAADLGGLPWAGHRAGSSSRMVSVTLAGNIRSVRVALEGGCPEGEGPQPHPGRQGERGCLHPRLPLRGCAVTVLQGWHPLSLLGLCP